MPSACRAASQLLAQRPRARFRSAAVCGLASMAGPASGAAKRLVVFGGSGFVGGAVAEEALRRGAAVLCLSRSGAPAEGLAKQPWAQRAQWAQADALQPDTYRDKLVGADAVVVSIGSPPLPFVDRASQKFVRRPADACATQRALLPRLPPAVELRRSSRSPSARARSRRSAAAPPQLRWRPLQRGALRSAL